MHCAVDRAAVMHDADQVCSGMHGRQLSMHAEVLSLNGDGLAACTASYLHLCVEN